MTARGHRRRRGIGRHARGGAGARGARALSRHRVLRHRRPPDDRGGRAHARADGEALGARLRRGDAQPAGAAAHPLGPRRAARPRPPGPLHRRRRARLQPRAGDAAQARGHPDGALREPVHLGLAPGAAARHRPRGGPRPHDLPLRGRRSTRRPASPPPTWGTRSPTRSRSPPAAPRRARSCGCNDAATAVALLPGSRRGELEAHADLFIDTALRLAAAAPRGALLRPARDARDARLLRDAPLRARGAGARPHDPLRPCAPGAAGRRRARSSRAARPRSRARSRAARW